MSRLTIAGNTKAAPVVGAGRIGLFVLTGVLLLGAAAMAQARWAAFSGAGLVAIDYRTFVDEGHRMLDHGTPYLAYQLAGPYSPFDVSILHDPATVPDLYPPPFALVGVALTFLPALLWWVVPLGILAWCVAAWRPAAWSWPLLALAACWPATSAIVIVGGTTMWVAALTAAGLRWGWPGALVLLKPSFLPLALAGIRTRGWWVSLAVLAAVSVALWPLWGQYIAAMRNAAGVSPLYSLGDLPLVAAPLLAWAARTG